MSEVNTFSLYCPEFPADFDNAPFWSSLKENGLTITGFINNNSLPDAILLCSQPSGFDPTLLSDTINKLDCPIIGISFCNTESASEDACINFDLLLDHDTPATVMIHRIKNLIRVRNQKTLLQNHLDNLAKQHIKLDNVASFGTKLTETLSYHQLYDLIVDYSAKLLPADLHVVYAVDNDQPVFRIRAARHHANSSRLSIMPSFRVSSDDRADLAKHITPVYVKSPFNPPAWLKNILVHFPMANSVLISPMVLKNHLLGVHVTINPFSKVDSTDIEQIETLATFSSISLGNAFVYEQSELLSSTDKLTNVFNFGFVKRFLEQLIDNREPFVFIFIDLDGFKKVNRDHGHTTGNRALRKAAGKITEMLEMYSICGRFGGDEFVIVIPGISADIALQQTNLIIKNIETLQAQMQLYISASAGIAEYPLDADNLDSIIHAADTAMYAAKDSGGGCTCLFSKL